MSIQLFSIHYRPSLSWPAVEVVCQAFDVDKEKLLWVDGLMVHHPILIPVSGATRLKYLGSFRDFMAARIPQAKAVLEVSQGQHSPGMLARAVTYMERERGLSAEAALDLAVDEALDIIDADNGDRAVLAAVGAGSAAAATG